MCCALLNRLMTQRYSNSDFPSTKPWLQKLICPALTQIVITGEFGVVHGENLKLNAAHYS